MRKATAELCGLFILGDLKFIIWPKGTASVRFIGNKIISKTMEVIFTSILEY